MKLGVSYRVTIFGLLAMAAIIYPKCSKATMYDFELNRIVQQASGYPGDQCWYDGDGHIIIWLANWENGERIWHPVDGKVAALVCQYWALKGSNILYDRDEITRIARGANGW
jgi:hypothetical protein